MKRLRIAAQIGMTLVVGSLGFITAIANAQAPAKTSPVQQYRRQPLARNYGGQVRREQPNEYKAANLDRDVVLPNLPGYTGKQIFVSGLTYPNARNAPGYMITYNTEHTKDQVKQWWANALNMPPWKVTFTDSSSIQATSKDGQKVTISPSTIVTTTPEKSKGMHGSYIVYYHDNGKPH